MNLLRKFASRSGAEQWLLLRATLALLTTAGCVRFLPFRLWRSLIAPADALSGSTPPSRHSAEQIAWAVAAVGRCVPGASCLPQAIAGYRLLRRAGYAARLRIGIAAGAQAPFEAHAWLELDGRILLGGTESAARYAALPLDLAGTGNSS